MPMTIMISLTTTYIVLLMVALARGAKCTDSDELVNVCIDSKYHKCSPGPESDLFKQCSPWQSRSCCTSDTTKDLHNGILYSLDIDHCAGKKPMSKGCKRHFTQDHCFYECSPNVGPWIVQEPHRTWRNERYFGVPLCATDCDSWYRDCQKDFTCTDNWSMNFDWVTINANDSNFHGYGTRCKNNATSCKVNVCPNGTTCITFAEMFGNSSNFCQKVWDGSWSYAADDTPCLRIWFDGQSANPNDAVAQLFADRMTYTSAASKRTYVATSVVVVASSLLAVLVMQAVV